MFLTNPSPICVLDEVDAPLDDHNVERFCNLLDAMLERTETRFLIITHHALTMARMHRLFGVTMLERGVSQLVSVNLEEAETHGGGAVRGMNVVFDIGNVLIHWDPRALYRKIFTSEDEVEWFLANVCTPDWNLEQDRGRSFEDAIAEAAARHPGPCGGDRRLSPPLARDHRGAHRGHAWPSSMS